MEAGADRKAGESVKERSMINFEKVSVPFLVPEVLLSPPMPGEIWGFHPRTVLIGATKWKKLRDIMIERHGKRCMCCGEAAKAVQMHEVYTYDFIDRIAEVHEFLLLCGKCHAYIHIDGLIARLGRHHGAIEEANDHGLVIIRNLLGIREQHTHEFTRERLIDLRSDLCVKTYTRRAGHRGVRLQVERNAGWWLNCDWLHIQLDEDLLDESTSREEQDLRSKERKRRTTIPWKVRFQGVDYDPALRKKSA